MERLELQLMLKKHDALLGFNVFEELEFKSSEIDLYNFIKEIPESENCKFDARLFQEIVLLICNSELYLRRYDYFFTKDHSYISRRTMFNVYKLFIIDPVDLSGLKMDLMPTTPSKNQFLGYLKDVVPSYECEPLSETAILRCVSYHEEMFKRLFHGVPSHRPICQKMDKAFKTWKWLRNDVEFKDFTIMLTKSVLEPIKSMISYVSLRGEISYSQKDSVHFIAPRRASSKLKRLNYMALDGQNVIYPQTNSRARHHLDDQVFPIFLTDEDILESAKFINGEEYTPQDIRLWKTFIAHILVSRKPGGMITNGRHTIVLVMNRNSTFSYDDDLKCMMALFAYKVVDHTNAHSKITLQMLYIMLLQEYNHMQHLQLLDRLVVDPRRRLY